MVEDKYCIEYPNGYHCNQQFGCWACVIDKQLKKIIEQKFGHE